LQVEELNCSHMDISEEPHISKVAEWLEKHLSEAEAKLVKEGAHQTSQAQTIPPR
jgi:hypothetical protein